MPYTLKGVSGKLTLSSRVALVGRNGAGKSTFMNLQYRYRFGDYDELYQKRLETPQSDDEAKMRKDLAQKYGKYGKQVAKCIGRQIRGKEPYYEVEWEGLDDPKQNTYEPLSKLKRMGAEGMAKAYDCRAAAQGGTARPTTRREVCKHLALFGIDEDMACNRPIQGLSAGQKSKLTLASAMWTKPHLIALDEPTNYIDQESEMTTTPPLKSWMALVSASRVS